MHALGFALLLGVAMTGAALVLAAVLDAAQAVTV